MVGLGQSLIWHTDQVLLPREGPLMFVLVQTRVFVLVPYVILVHVLALVADLSARQVENAPYAYTRLEQFEG